MDQYINKMTPVQVRDEIISCFSQAHCRDTGLEIESSQIYCTNLIEKAFTAINGNYENPTKTDLFALINHLAVFSETFRAPEVIERHFKEMKQLIDALPE